MFTALCPGAISVSTPTLESRLAAARDHHFGGVEIDVVDLTDRIERDGADVVQALWEEYNVIPAAWGLPVNWNGDEARWKEDLGRLPSLAKAAATLGCTRCATWVMPGSNSLECEANREFHLKRLAPIAEILADHDCSLGLEFIGPKTLRDTLRFPFVYTMKDMLSLGAQVGSNVGLLLDSFHWYTSGATLEDLRSLSEKDVVYVHINDARLGRTVDEQLDGERCLPGETGVIDLVGFLQALQSIGYRGPVTPEPFRSELKDLPDDEARLAEVARSMRDIFVAAGV